MSTSRISTMDNIFVSSMGTQTEQLTSPLLWSCLRVIKSAPEFKCLSYRVTTDMNDNELLIINRDRVTRVFGPPIEPISLTLDPSGKCLLAIPFRPVQHIPITKAKMGMLDLPSLHALLLLVVGKGFCFCPGIPVKFLAGRACGKFVVMHRTPFKRFNAVGCPVYFKFPKSVETANGGPFPIRTLCPSCRQVAKWAQTLPVSQNVTRHPPVTNPVPQGHMLYPVPSAHASKKSVPMKDLNTSRTEISHSTDQALIVTNPSLPLTVVDSSKFNGIHSNAPEVRKENSLVSDKPIKRIRGLNSEKAQAVSDSLRQLLKQRYLYRESPADLAAKHKGDGSGQKGGGDKSSGSSRPRSPRSDKSKKNVCQICFKQFSTNLRLSKHVQRHEGYGPNLSQGFRRKMRKRKSLSVFNSLLRGFSSRSSSVNRRYSDLSEWSLQLMLNYLEDLSTGEGKSNVDGVRIHKGQEKKKSRGKRKAEESVPQQHMENPTTRPGLHRAGSGLAAVQTLLNAAQLADVEDAKSNNYPASNGLNSEFPNTYLAAKRDADSPSDAKKARQSGRLAAKRAGKRSKHKSESKESNFLPLQGNNDTTSNARPSDEALTNLNLLSTVSLNAELRDNRGSPGLQLLSYAGNLDSKMNNTSPNSNKNSMLCQSPSADSIPTTGIGRKIAQRQQIPTTVVSKEGPTASKNKNLPPIPPLILAKDNIILNPSPHSSAASSPLVPTAACALPILQQLHNNITKGNSSNAVTSSNVNLLPHEDVLGSNCGAMDLSKPKPLTLATDAIRKSTTAPVPQDSADMLRHLMMINNPMAMSQKSLGQPELPHDPRMRLLSSKEADDSLQARMFASAKNYKVDPSKLIASGHIPAVISSSQPSGSSGKQSKGKDKFNLPVPLNDKSEIQCGYKWSGSGGLVKERTQLVRELVPSVVMSNILNGPVTSSALSMIDDPISAPIQSVCKPKVSDKKKQLAQSLMSKSSSYPPVTITGSQNSTHPNLITLKPRDAPVRPKTPQYVLNLSKNRKESEVQTTIPSPVQLTSKSSTVSFPASILKTSLLNQPSVLIPTSILAPKPSIPTPIASNPTGKKPTANMSVLAPLRNTVLGTLPSPILPAPQVPNSTTLATILRHPAKTTGSHTPSKASESSYSGKVSSSVVPQSSSGSKSSPVIELADIKTEPVVEVFNKNGKMHTLIPNSFGEATIVKIDKPSRASSQQSAERDLSTPPNLVVDISGDKKELPVSGKSIAKANSSNNKSLMKGKVSIVNTPLKCEFCSQVFRTIRDNEYHVCPKPHD